MNIFDVASTAISGILSGGATGLIGLGLQQFFEYRKRQQDIAMMELQHKQTLELRALDNQQQIRMAEMSAASAERLAEIDAMARATESADANFRASFGNDKASYLDAKAQQRKGFVGGLVTVLMGLVDFMRGMIRPGMTIYSNVLLALLMLWVQRLWDQHNVVMDKDATVKLAMSIIDTITYLATTTCVWWFGVRSNQKK